LENDRIKVSGSLKDSYIGKVADALAPYTAELTAKGFDPTSRIGQLTGAAPSSRTPENSARPRQNPSRMP